MPHHFEKVHGWTTFLPFYKWISDTIPEGSHIVEIGAWAGRSIIFLAEAIKESGKQNIVIDAVDTWLGCGDEEPEQKAFIEQIGGDLYEHFLKNIKDAGVDDIITPIRLPSVFASTKYKRESLDFIFVDGGHFGGQCFQDISHFWPKLKVGGIMAGHDASCADVHNDIKDFFGSGKFQIDTSQDIWLVRK